MDASAFSSLGRAVSLGFKIMLTLLCIFVPLGAWKAWEIAVWLCQHVKISVG